MAETRDDRADAHAFNPLPHAIGWLGAAVTYAKARAELALIEAKEAGAHYGWVAGLFGGAALLALLGYPFLILSAVFGIGLLFANEHAWIAVLAVVALLHFAGAAALVFVAKKRLKAGVFQNTKEEFKNDQLWLNHSAKNP